jgi:signal transduction histidine kinase
VWLKLIAAYGMLNSADNHLFSRVHINTTGRIMSGTFRPGRNQERVSSLGSRRFQLASDEARNGYSPARQWHRIVDALAVIAELVRDRRSTEELPSAMAAGAAQAIGADLAILRVADLIASTLETRAVHGFDQQVRDELTGVSMSLFDSQVMLASPRASVFELLHHQPVGFTRAELASLRSRNIRHGLSVPLLHHGRLIGRLDLMTASGEQFTSEQQVVSESLGAVIAGTLAEEITSEPTMNSRVANARLTPPSFGDISDYREMYQYLVQWMQETLGGRQCYGFIWSEPRSSFLPVAVSGGDPESVQALKGIRLLPEVVPAFREAIRSSAPYVIPDARETALFPPEMSAALDLQRVTILPLRGSTGQLVGSVLLDYTDEQEISEAFLDVVAQAGNYASIMLENSLLYETVQRSSENLTIVNEIGIELSTLSDLDSLFSLVFSHIRSVMETTCFAVGLTTQDHEQVEYRYAVENRIMPDAVTVPLGNDALSRVISTRQPQIARDAATIQRANWFPISELTKTLQSGVAVPIVVGRDAIGVLTAQSDDPGSYDADALSLLEIVGLQLGVAIQNARLYAIMRARGERRGFLLDQVITQQESERKMLVDDIHNHTLQTLAHCLVQLDLAHQHTGQLSVDEAREKISRVRDTLAENIDQLRSTIFQLRPSTLDILGLESALREYFTQFETDTGIRTELEINLPDRFDTVAETRVYRLVQEAVDTIRHREEVSRIGFRIRQRAHDILITIADDGHGVSSDVLDDVNRPQDHEYSDIERRLITLRERAELGGGTLQLTRRSGGGSLIQVVLPYRSSE